MHGSPLDYEKHFQIPFYSYAQFSDEPQPSNTQLVRTIDPMVNIHKSLSLDE